MSTETRDPIEFIKLLKSQHKSIISTVYEIDSQDGGASNLKNSIDKLNRITDLLFDHLEREDKQLYPALITNEKTAGVAKKYYYDMERLSCIALDFFKRFCVNREGLKIFAEDFVNSYLLFKGLLKVRIQREELELYPAFVLLHSGVLYSDVVDFIQEEEAKKSEESKRIIFYGENPVNLEALSLVLEMNGYSVEATKHQNQLASIIDSRDTDLVVIDTTNTNKELNNLIRSIKEQYQDKIKIVGFSSNLVSGLEDNTQKKLDDFISRPALNVEEFSR